MPDTIEQAVGEEGMEGVSLTNNWLKRKGAAKAGLEDDKKGDRTEVSSPESKRKPIISETGSEQGKELHTDPPKQDDRFDCFLEEMKKLREGIDKLQTTTDRLDVNTSKLDRKFTEMQGKLEKVEGVADQACATAGETRDELRQLKEEVLMLKSEVAKSGAQDKHKALRHVEKNVEKLEGYSRRFNLVIEGLKEPEGETDVQLRQKVVSFIKNILAVSDVHFDITHRLGPEGRANRKTIVKFLSLWDKDKVWGARTALKAEENKHYKMFMDKPRGVKEREALAFKITRAAQRTNRYRRVRFHRGLVWLDDRAYQFAEYDRLPEDLRPRAISSPRSLEVVVFYSHFSPFSNHHWAPFTANDVYYTTVEQFLARERALFADNEFMAEQAMETDDPLDHSRFLHQLKADGLDTQWRQAVPDILEYGILQKFRQNTAARDFLVESGSRKIGEATLDAFWGIGMSLNDSRIFNFKLWSEINLMGKTLMKVRDTFKKEPSLNFPRGRINLVS